MPERPERVSGEGKQLCQCQCHPDFSWMKFGDSRIHPTDVDCMFVVERRGRFLWIEWKEAKETLTMGQKILAEQLSMVPGFTVLLLRGFGDGSQDRLTVEKVTGGEWGILEVMDKTTFQARLDDWYAAANRVRA